MDPNYQVEEQPTFETTLFNTEAIRKKFASMGEDDWPKYKLMFIASLQSGRDLTQRVVDMEAQVKHYLVRKTKFDELEADVDALKAMADARRTFLDRWGNRLWMLFLALIAWALGHWVH